MELAYATDHNRFVGRSGIVGEWIADADCLSQSPCRSVCARSEQWSIARGGICRIALIVTWRCSPQSFGLCRRCSNHSGGYPWRTCHIGVDSFCGAVCAWQCHLASHRCDDGLSCHGNHRCTEILQCRGGCQGIRGMGVGLFHPHLRHSARCLHRIDVPYPAIGDVADKDDEHTDAWRRLCAKPRT